ncbi:hypothetical protein C8J56DRAFT_321192 [Mycena floridula]|nr:hypothetical protein C8J56DRAFT_321192 [Mycena floridula]
MSSEICSGFATTNSDISGVGVRVSFYLQTFLLVLLVDRSWQDAPVALWTFIFTSLGLMLAAVVDSKDLTFFQALQVSLLVWLANFGTFVALASYSRKKAASHRRKKHRKKQDPDYGVKIGAMLQTCLSMILTIYMWVTAPTFGPISACSTLIYFPLFGARIKALGSGRIVSLVFASFLTVAYCATTLHELRSYYINRARKSKSSGECCDTDLEKGSRAGGTSLTMRSASSIYNPGNRRLPPSPLILPSASYPRILNQDVSSSPTETTNPGSRKMTSAISLGSSNDLSSRQNIAATSSPQLSPTLLTSTPTNVTYLSTSPRTRPKRRKWSLEIDEMFVGILICQILVFGYFIACSELLLHYNNADDSNAIGFGQILALIVVLPSLLSVVGALRKNGLRRLTKKKLRKSRKRIPKRRKSSKPALATTRRSSIHPVTTPGMVQVDNPNI